MCVFIDFWKLETEYSILHVFSFLHKLSFENSFCFLSILGCQTSFLVSKIENCFWKQKIRRKKSYQTYPNVFFCKFSLPTPKLMVKMLINFIKNMSVSCIPLCYWISHIKSRVENHRDLLELKQVWEAKTWELGRMKEIFMWLITCQRRKDALCG